jgi:plastocyanin
MARHIIRARMRRPLTPALALLIALAGCGGGGGGGKSVTVAAGKPIAVTADEYRFDPKAIVVTGASKGTTTLRIELRNDGGQAHDLHVERDGKDLGGTPVFGPGQTQSGSVKLAPGKYDFFCSVGDHEALGMKGTLEIR